MDGWIWLAAADADGFQWRTMKQLKQMKWGEQMKNGCLNSQPGTRVSHFIIHQHIQMHISLIRYPFIENNVITNNSYKWLMCYWSLIRLSLG